MWLSLLQEITLLELSSLIFYTSKLRETRLFSGREFVPSLSEQSHQSAPCTVPGYYAYHGDILLRFRQPYPPEVLVYDWSFICTSRVAPTDSGSERGLGQQLIDRRTGRILCHVTHNKRGQKGKEMSLVATATSSKYHIYNVKPGCHRCNDVFLIWLMRVTNMLILLKKMKTLKKCVLLRLQVSRY